MSLQTLDASEDGPSWTTLEPSLAPEVLLLDTQPLEVLLLDAQPLEVLLLDAQPLEVLLLDAQPLEVLLLDAQPLEIAQKYDLQREEELRFWIEEMTGMPIGENFQKGLKDGVILSELINKLKPGSVKKINHSQLNWHKLENLGNFIKAILAYGMKPNDIFEANDLFESGNLTQVQTTLLALASMAKTKGIDSKMDIGVKYADKQARHFDHDKIKAGQCVIDGNQQVCESGGDDGLRHQEASLRPQDAHRQALRPDHHQPPDGHQQGRQPGDVAQPRPRTAGPALALQAPPSHCRPRPRTTGSALAPQAPPSHHRPRPRTTGSSLVPQAPPSHRRLLPHTAGSSLVPHAPPSYRMLLPHTAGSSLTPHAPPSHRMLLPHTAGSSLTPQAPPSHRMLLPHTAGSSLTPHAPPSHRRLLPHTAGSSLTPQAPPSHRMLLPHTACSSLTPQAPPSHRRLLPRTTGPALTLLCPRNEMFCPEWTTKSNGTAWTATYSMWFRTFTITPLWDGPSFLSGILPNEKV
ncbi:hypothetical protein NHX12_021069 [Muraenolepis orangiensis]|uniref:Calponin-homology (CH) domain-containing protein n=1 Tax=Muraenolepis orangiensis TaxID=630683 RepID=A0A9Q0IV59_9TELE|nr:hypothetical protein NHX12_021069 [Muraenolepis orangiensis]